jgi:hypothetical protein
VWCGVVGAFPRLPTHVLACAYYFHRRLWCAADGWPLWCTRVRSLCFYCFAVVVLQVHVAVGLCLQRGAAHVASAPEATPALVAQAVAVLVQLERAALADPHRSCVSRAGEGKGEGVGPSSEGRFRAVLTLLLYTCLLLAAVCTAPKVLAPVSPTPPSQGPALPPSRMGTP